MTFCRITLCKTKYLISCLPHAPQSDITILFIEILKQKILIQSIIQIGLDKTQSLIACSLKFTRKRIKMGGKKERKESESELYLYICMYVCVCVFTIMSLYIPKKLQYHFFFFFLIGKIKKNRNKEETPKQRLQVHRKYIVEA